MICSETGRVILGGILYDVVHDWIGVPDGF
jgi:hypothetical protein